MVKILSTWLFAVAGQRTVCANLAMCHLSICVRSLQFGVTCSSRYRCNEWSVCNVVKMNCAYKKFFATDATNGDKIMYTVLYNKSGLVTV